MVSHAPFGHIQPIYDHEECKLSRFVHLEGWKRFVGGTDDLVCEFDGEQALRIDAELLSSPLLCQVSCILKFRKAISNFREIVIV